MRGFGVSKHKSCLLQLKSWAVHWLVHHAIPSEPYSSVLVFDYNTVSTLTQHLILITKRNWL